MKNQLIEKLLENMLDEENETPKDCPFEIGKAYLVRTVTYHQIGILKEIIGDFLIFKEASWVADSGRFSECISKGQFSEVEYVGAMIVNKTAIVDAFPWENKVPKETK